MKKIIKFLTGLAFLIIIDLPLYMAHKIIFFSSTRSFTTISELTSMFPGYMGYFIRKGFYLLAINSGKGFYTGFGTILQYPSITVRDDVYIGQNCNIAKCTIGSGTKIGSGVHIVNKNTHDIDDGKIMATDVKKLKRVRIGENVWIGNNSVVMADIGDDCVIGAGSVVVKPIPSGCIAAGNPAKVIQKR